MRRNKEWEDILIQYRKQKSDEKAAEQLREELEKGYKEYKIHQHTKNALLSIEAPLLPSRDKIKIIASPEAWEDLEALSRNDPYNFVALVKQQFINPAIRKIKYKPPRGSHKGNEDIVSELKEVTPWLYLFVSYWLKKNAGDWPEPFREVIENLRKSDYKLVIKKAVNITENLIEIVYGIDWINNFSNIYLYRNPLFKRAKKEFQETVTDNEHDTLYLPGVHKILNTALSKLKPSR